MNTATEAADLWAELVASENRRNPQHHRENIAVVYGQKGTHKTLNDDASRRVSSSSKESKLAFEPVKRISWNRSLSTRGRISIAVAACVDRPKNQQKKKPMRRAGKPPIPKGGNYQPPNFEKEQAYFQEVDSFELLEESPSPKKSGTWVTTVPDTCIQLPYMSSVLQKWLIAKKCNRYGGLFGSLSKILETPTARLGESTNKDGHGSLNMSLSKTLEVQNELGLDSIDKDRLERESRGRDKSVEDVEVAVGKLSLEGGHVSQGGFSWNPLSPLLEVCGQASPLKLIDVFSKYCGPDSIVKVGEGTFGEAFRAGENVCKVVPFGGELKVNGEVQKRSDELLEEAVLSSTLNHLRRKDGHVSNFCTTFIETKELRVCQGPYDEALIKAWENWDGEHISENDHPKDFSEKQCYIVFVQEHGGQDLESFVLLNFNEARSLLVQVTVALAVAEVAYEFEHRDLHWGNILLSRKETATLHFILHGQNIFIKTFGLSVSIIDFTLSRINTGEDILFLDLSTDQELFEGPKRDKQSETYRRMKEVTEECWEGSFPKTNVLWLQYLVDILLVKKSYDRTLKDERDLRSLKKRLNTYKSAKEASFDPFFGDLFVERAIPHV